MSSFVRWFACANNVVNVFYPLTGSMTVKFAARPELFISQPREMSQLAGPRLLLIHLTIDPSGALGSRAGSPVRLAADPIRMSSRCSNYFRSRLHTASASMQPLHNVQRTGAVALLRAAKNCGLVPQDPLWIKWQKLELASFLP